MTTELKIPTVGESISEVQIAEWLKADGDEIKKDENVAVLDSEKTTLELPAPESGRLKILRQAGEMAKIGEVVGRIESNGEAEKAKPAEKAEPEKGTGADTQSVPDSGANVVQKKVDVSEMKKVSEQAGKKEEPSASQKNAGQDSSLSQTEKERTETGRIPVQREEAETGKMPVLQEDKIVPMTMLRRTAAKRLVEARQQMAMLTTFNEADMSAIQSLRKEFQESFEKRYQVKLGFMSFFVKAVSGALKQSPQLNAEIRENDIVYHNRFDIGVAIASDRGLVVPVLRDAGQMSFAEIERAIGDFAKRATEGKLKPDELEGGTFTITNGGVFGSLLSTPIINPPQTGILGMHAIQERPIALHGQVVIRPMMYLALTYDHRLVDGREAVLFLRRIKEIIESPSRMLIEA